VALLEGDTAQARRHLEEILTLFPGNALPKIRALALVTLGDVARAEGDPLQARARYEASLACAKRCGNDLGVAQALEGFAQVAMHAGQAAWAVRLVGVGAVLREAAGTPLAPVECQAVEGLMARARAALGDDMYEGERAAGRMLTLEYAIGAIADQDVPGWTPRAHGSSAHRA
jgi:ATP/maltotriose-dependent transcriptional regulator MalT